MIERDELGRGREVLPRDVPWRGCPVCLRPVDWVYSERDLRPGVFGLGRPRCDVHGVQLGWVVVEGDALQSEFLTGGFVKDSSEWKNVLEGEE